MGLFGCPHRWKKYGRKRKGYQQYRCGKCGRLKMEKVRKVRFCMHRWKLDRRRKGGNKLICRKCGEMKEASRYPRGAEPRPDVIESGEPIDVKHSQEELDRLGRYHGRAGYN